MYPSKLHNKYRSKRQGVAMVYFALSLTAMFGMAGLVVDMGRLYMARAEAQRAADAAALAGAAALADPRNGTTDTPQAKAARAKTEAERYAKENGFDIADTAHGVQVVSIVAPPGFSASAHRAFVRKRINLYFMPVLKMNDRFVSARATAEMKAPLPMEFGVGDDYGRTGRRVNYSVFGPYGQYQNGDAYSPKYLTNGTTNPFYDGKGYNFNITLDPTYTKPNLEIQLFDPDTYNNGGDDAKFGERIDEIRYPSTPVAGKPDYNGQHITTTRYTLYERLPNGTINPIPKATAIYDGSSNLTDMKWVTPDGFSFPLEGTSRSFVLNVTSIGGASENGFDIRAGDPAADHSNEGAYANNGTHVAGEGKVPINFNQGGDVTVTLANIPAVPAGYSGTPEVYVHKFDTDVGSENVYFTADPPPANMPSGGWQGRLSGNGEWVMDTFSLPNDYAGGKLKATYRAGTQDTSVWRVESSFAGQGPSDLTLVE